MVSDVSVSTPKMPGQYVCGNAHGAMSPMLLCVPVVSAYPASMPLQAATLPPLAVLVVPVGQLMATALAAYVPEAAVNATKVDIDVSTNTRAIPGQCVRGVVHSVMSLTLM